MKIGVALSGCDVGGICAFKILSRLASYGFEIGLLSACCVPAAAALLYAGGCDGETMQRLSESFFNDARGFDMDFAIANFSAAYKPGKGTRIPVAISAVDVEDGGVVTFTDHYALETGNIKTAKMCDTYDMLSAAVSFAGGLGSYRYGGRRLCDYSCWYGCPIHPLRLAGFTKIISLSYLPKQPENPYEALVKRMTASNSAAADIHISTEFDGSLPAFEDYLETALTAFSSRADEIILNTVF